jgi:hypothetical protein
MGENDFPQYVAFKGDNGKYLGFFLDNENRGFLKFGYDDLSSPFVKHEVVSDPTNESYLHIKCCYNNKFWRRHSSNHWWIFAGEDSINTDLSSWSCTLFAPEFVGSNKVSLRSMQLKKFAARWRTGDKLDSCLFAGEDKPDECGVMIYYDLGLLVSLPKYVAFKGDNGMYLAAFWTESHEYLQFNTDDIGSGLVRHEVVPVGDGTVRVKCLHWNKFWRRSPNWIWADTLNYDSSNKDLLFQPVKVDKQTVALRCLGNNWFCKRLTTEGKTSCLNAGTGSLERTAILRVEEPTFSRKVHSVKYHMDTAHIYDLQPLVLSKATVTNNSEQPTTLQVSFAYAEKKSTTWKSAVSFATGIKTTFEAGIPFVVDAKVELSALVTLSGEFGGTTETLTTVTGTYPAPVKAGQTVELMVKGTSAKCDVKYSYVQEDLLSTGDTVKVHRDDGVFNGVNYTDVQFETHYS